MASALFLPDGNAVSALSAISFLNLGTFTFGLAGRHALPLPAKLTDISKTCVRKCQTGCKSRLKVAVTVIQLTIKIGAWRLHGQLKQFP